MGRVFIDISAPLSADLVTWPGVVERFERNLLVSIDRGDGMNVSEFRLGAHAGTHVDAPNHFLPEAGGIESVPLDALVGPVQVIEIPAGTAVITGGLLQESAVQEHVERLIVKTENSGWSKGNVEFRTEYVAFDESGAEWCLDRRVKLVGIDYLSVEPFDADERDFPVHRMLLGADVAVVESLDLLGVAPGRYELAVLPLLAPGADGAPARAVLSRG